VADDSSVVVGSGAAVLTVVLSVVVTGVVVSVVLTVVLSVVVTGVVVSVVLTVVLSVVVTGVVVSVVLTVVLSVFVVGVVVSAGRSAIKLFNAQVVPSQFNHCLIIMHCLH